MQESDMSKYYEGQRLSLKSQLCTIRYIGAVADKGGDWLGVEWDDPKRGKHDGTHGGIKYFECRNKHATAASFLRPDQPWDNVRTFFQALEEKYLHKTDRTQDEIIYVSGKQAEEIGFEKFARRQAKLRGIHVLVLDGMRIQHQRDEAEADRISNICSHITDLDLSSNLFEFFDEIAHLCKLLPKLRSLTLDGNRFLTDGDAATFSSVRSLGLSNTLLTWVEISALVTQHFMDASTLVVKENVLIDVRQAPIPDSIKTLDLSGNEFCLLEHTWPKVEGCSLRTVLLKHNHINKVFSESATNSSTEVEDLDLSYNSIDDWKFFNPLPLWAPNLKHLRVTGNPLYKDLKSIEGKHLTAEDGYMLTIARLPTLETLNYSKITDKERLNAETYYLNQIAAELSSRSAEQEDEVLSTHPRYAALCEEYGKPTISRQDDKANAVDPNTLAHRLVTIHFSHSPDGQSWTDEIPKSFNIYAVLGLVGKKLSISPLRLRLVWETGERDPKDVHFDNGTPEFWDSSDEEDLEGGTNMTGENWNARDVELVAGTRLLGTYIESHEAIVRVEVKDENS